MASETFHRIHWGHQDPADILRPERQRSTVWIGGADIECQHCGGSGWDPEDRDYDCPACAGRQQITITDQHGVSACRSIDDLMDYMQTRDGDIAGNWLVTFEGELADETDVDAAHGAVLTIPTRIISVEQL